jgi:hypothetical protein
MSSTLDLLMISAMYENGGNVTHRLFDGHPELFVYPFESQLGTALVRDHLSSLFPVKYRWPVFSLEGTPGGDYEAIIDEECRVRARTPRVSKFRHMPFKFSDADRRRLYEERIRRSGRSRANNVAAFLAATFDAWKDRRASGRERVYVGYSPIVVVDAEQILADFPAAQVLHVVRNPWSAYADHKKRPVPLPLATYLLGWSLNQHCALLAQRKFPERLHVVRLEDVLAAPARTLGAVCERIGVSRARTLQTPTWNGRPLDEVYPWGTIRTATPAANRATAAELSPDEQAEVRTRAADYLEIFEYDRLVPARR